MIGAFQSNAFANGFQRAVSALTRVVGGGGKRKGIYWQDQPRRKIERNWLDKILDTIGIDDVEAVEQFVEERKEQPVIKKVVRKHLAVDNNIKWKQLERDIAAMKALLLLYQQFVIEQEDEEIMPILMELM